MERILKVQCCVCGRIKENGVWDKIKRAIDRTQCFSHSYCPDCYKIELKKLEELDVPQMRIGA